ncbi:MAG: FecR domain-containing protein [Bacteroidales bacterium]|nr:FecR domain-containing protein [Bacteroidales bacterium]
MVILKWILKNGVLMSVLFFILIVTTSCGANPFQTPLRVSMDDREIHPTLTEEIDTPPAPSLTIVPSLTIEPTIPNSAIILPDGSQIILKPETRIEILQQPGIPLESVEITVKILKGEIMVVPNIEENAWFNVQNSSDITAQVQGCAMVVNVDDQSDSFGIKCIDSNCNVALTSENLVSLTSNFAWIIQDGLILDNPEVIDFTTLSKDYAEDMPVCVANAISLPIPQTSGQASTFTPTPTRTPDLAATATSACADFQEQFPATPCPPSP